MNILLKLIDSGVGSVLPHWIAEFLIDRHLRVAVSGKNYSSGIVTSGVPLGSVSGYHIKTLSVQITIYFFRFLHQVIRIW